MVKIKDPLWDIALWKRPLVNGEANKVPKA